MHAFVLFYPTAPCLSPRSLSLFLLSITPCHRLKPAIPPFLKSRHISAALSFFAGRSLTAVLIVDLYSSGGNFSFDWLLLLLALAGSVEEVAVVVAIAVLTDTLARFTCTPRLNLLIGCYRYHQVVVILYEVNVLQAGPGEHVQMNLSSLQSKSKFLA